MDDTARAARTPRQVLDDEAAIDLIARGDKPGADRVLNISKATAWRRCRDGSLPTVRVGRRVLVSTAVLRRLLALDEAS